MLKYTFSFIFSFLLMGYSLQAQLSEGGQPKSNSLSLKAPQHILMPAVDVTQLMAEDVEDLASNLPLRFAYGHEVNYNLNNTGQWETIKGGDRVWRLAIHCPNALNINFMYNDFYLPKGAQFFIYNEDKSQILGAFTSQNNKVNKKFATALIHDDMVILEYYEPAISRGEGRIQLSQIAHGYRYMDNPYTEDTGSLGNSGDCQVNVNCAEGSNWQNEKKGVGKIVMDGLYLCTGTLINNTANDCKPLFLTANHCLQGGIPQDAILNPDVSGYIFYWNFEYQNCGNSGFVAEQTTSGGTVLANSGPNTTGTYTLTGSDFGLIQLDENPRDAYDVYFNGWDASGVSGNTGVGIHHPGGDAKKISTHNTTPAEDGYYWALYWDPTANGHSVTEGGSSGSALFRENGRIIGQLFGGGSVNCDDPANDLGLYGRLSYSWTNDDEPTSGDVRRRLNEWLDPIGGGSIRTIVGAYDPCETPKVYFTESQMSVNEGAANVDNNCLDYTDYSFNIGITPYPTSPVQATIHAISSSATAGVNRDYQILSPSVTFNSIFNVQTVQVRVYDDEYNESLEGINFGFTINGAAESMGVNDEYRIDIVDNDAIPTTHIQSVSNDDTPDEIYLGPSATVYFQDAGSGGMMLKVENMSSHDFGCTQVAVDNAGGSANNNWNNGTTASKTYWLSPDNPNSTASVKVTAYFTQSELNGWEWFNGTDDTRNDLMLYLFDGFATPTNQTSAQTNTTTQSIYGSGESYTTSFNGLNATNGICAGVLNGAGGGFSIDNDGTGFGNDHLIGTMNIAPNPVTSQLTISWEASTSESYTISMLNVNGQLLKNYTLQSIEGFNKKQIMVDDLSAGVYLISLQSASGESTVQRFIKK